ncbi:AAA family ATPase [Actinoplanes missouriensis]|uniref:AAA family ATPase n=1 Tax=Actinoplanes missouriensis TaxID=1866 RepID=UPI0033FAEC5A
MNVFVLVGGWPGSGKSTLSRALATELGIACLAKDEIKDALMDSLGAPETVTRSRELGVAAVHAVVRAARGCPGAVIDSTWYPYAFALVRELPGQCVEVRCRVPVEVARQRYRRRVRDGRHLDGLRDEDELWATEVAPLGVGPLIDVDNAGEVDIPALARRILATP